MTQAPERMVLQPCAQEGWDVPDRVKYVTEWGAEYIRKDISDARIAELEGVLKCVADELQEEVISNYPDHLLQHSHNQQKFQNDMETVHLARETLAKMKAKDQ